MCMACAPRLLLSLSSGRSTPYRLGCGGEGGHMWGEWLHGHCFFLRPENGRISYIIPPYRGSTREEDIIRRSYITLALFGPRPCWHVLVPTGNLTVYCLRFHLLVLPKKFWLTYCSFLLKNVGVAGDHSCFCNCAWSQYCETDSFVPHVVLQPRSPLRRSIFAPCILRPLLFVTRDLSIRDKVLCMRPTRLRVTTKMVPHSDYQHYRHHQSCHHEVTHYPARPLPPSVRHCR